MKLLFLVLFSLVLCVVLADGSKSAMRAAVTKCSKEAKTTPATFEALLTTRKIPDTQLEKCFLGCLYKKIGLTKSGQLNPTRAQVLAINRYSKNREQLKKALTIIDQCKTIDGVNDDCFLGFKLRECFITNSDDKFTPFLSEKP